MIQNRLYALSLATLIGLASSEAAPPFPDGAYDNVSDYGYTLWQNGITAPLVYYIKTSRYAVSFDVTNFCPIAFFPLTNPPPESVTLSESLGASFPPSPPVSFGCSVIVDGMTNRVGPASNNARDAQLVECGKFFQRRWHKVSLPGGPVLNTNRSGLEVAAWPDRISFVLRVVPSQAVPNAALEMKLGLTNLYGILLTQGAGSALQAADGSGFVFIKTAANSSVTVDPAGALVTAGTSPGLWNAGQEYSVGLIVYPATNVAAALSGAVAAETSPLVVTAAGIVPPVTNLDVFYDPERGWYDVSLPKNGSTAADANLRAHLRVANATSSPRVIRLNFDGVPFYIPGISAVLRDDSLNPLGIPVQLSKNWHNGTADRFIGEWFHGLTMLTVPAGAALSFELAMAGQNWGGMPAATHSQLCVIGYGGNQQWDEAALGNYGEALTYDVEHVLTDNDCADSRPLLTTDAQGHHGAWGVNSGGASFLRYFDTGGHERPHNRLRTRYHRYGPNLAEAIFAGKSDDGTMEFSDSVVLFRSDDYTRGFHHIRMDVKADMAFSRLVFFQQAADTYAYDNGDTLAYGDAGTPTPLRLWPATFGLNQYVGTPVALTGPSPWVMTLNCATESGQGSYSGANRGFVIRSWHARIQGTDNVPPYIVERSLTGASIIDMVPPPGVTTLKAGDYIEAEIVRFYVPKFASNYYGPNASFSAALSNYQNTYHLALREAIGNNITVNVQSGTLEHVYPIQIRAANNQAAFTVRGGLGFVPVTCTGLTGYQAPVLEESQGGAWQPVNQAVNGKDFWQCDYNAEARSWEITFNVKLDGTNYQDDSALLAAPQTHAFRFHLAKRPGFGALVPPAGGNISLIVTGDGFALKDPMAASSPEGFCIMHRF